MELLRVSCSGKFTTFLTASQPEAAFGSKSFICLFSRKHVDCLHAAVEGLHPMTTKNTYQNRIELLQGTLDMLILKTLQWGTQHGYGISQAIRATSGEVLQVETGSLYPALHRLERQGWVTSEWKQSESNQRAKFYKITKLGKQQLASDYERWGKMVATIEGIMTATRGDA
jgi:transcriptional regulator